MVSDQEPRYRLVDANGNIVGSLYGKPDGSVAIQETASGSDREVALAPDGTFSAPSVETESVSTAEVQNSAIGDGINYLDPQWVAQYDGYVFWSYYESLDNWVQSTSGSGSIEYSTGRVEFNTGSTAGSEATLEFLPNRLSYTASFDNEITLKFGMNVSQTANGEGYHTVGRVGTLSNAGFGFKTVDEGSILGVTHDGTSENTVDTGAPLPTGNDTTVCEARHIPGSKVEFYIDGTKEAESQTNLPTGETIEARFPQHHITNTEDANRRFRTSDIRVVMQ